MRAVLLVALAAVLAVLLVRVVVLRRDHRWSVAVLVVLLVVLGAFEYRWATSVAALSKASRAVAPQAQGVTCQRFIGTFGYAGAEQGHVDFDADGVPARTAFLSYEACGRLFDYLRSDKSAPSLEQVIGVHTLTHEAMHLRGEIVESLAECSAMQRDAVVARSLGATEAQARALAARYVTEVYPRMPPSYTASECAARGRLDETPEDGLWP